jgi:hypothetical protein
LLGTEVPADGSQVPQEGHRRARTTGVSYGGVLAGMTLANFRFSDRHRDLAIRDLSRSSISE